MEHKLIAIILFILLSPVYIAVSILIFLEDGTPIFFTQKRVGINSTFFLMYKFRSMKKKRQNVATDLLKNQQFFPYLKGE
jgi:O-antigen biosynthesis protein WbqP